MTQDGWRDSALAKDAEDRALARTEARRSRRASTSESEEGEAATMISRREAAEAHAARYGG